MASTANLTKALAQGTVKVQKLVSGEVRIQCYDPNIPVINLNHNFSEDLMKHKGITSESLRKSNLNDLVVKGFVKVLL